MNGSQAPGDDPGSLYTGEPVSPRTARFVSIGLLALLVGFVVYMVLAATVLKGDEAAGVSFAELKDQPIYRESPPASRENRAEQGQSGVPGDSAHRWVVRGYVTRLTPEQVRSWYLRQFGTSYSLQDVSTYDNAVERVVRGQLVLSERTTANPPTLSIRVAIKREQVEERTGVTLSVESDY